MTIEALTVLFLVSGALALVLMGRALEPDNGRFPCTGPALRTVLAIYALAIFNRASVLFVALYVKHTTAVVTIDVFLGAAGMCLTHNFILYRLLVSRMPHGVWARLQRRVAVARRAVP